MMQRNMVISRIRQLERQACSEDTRTRFQVWAEPSRVRRKTLTKKPSSSKRQCSYRRNGARRRQRKSTQAWKACTRSIEQPVECSDLPVYTLWVRRWQALRKYNAQQVPRRYQLATVNKGNGSVETFHYTYVTVKSYLQNFLVCDYQSSTPYSSSPKPLHLLLAHSLQLHTGAC